MFSVWQMILRMQRALLASLKRVLLGDSSLLLRIFPFAVHLIQSLLQQTHQLVSKCTAQVAEHTIETRTQVQTKSVVFFYVPSVCVCAFSFWFVCVCVRVCVRVRVRVRVFSVSVLSVCRLHVW